MEQQLETIQRNVELIKRQMKNQSRPIFIELTGTPKSGKTTLVRSFELLCQKSGVEFSTRRETAEYNPIEDKAVPEYNMWMFMELFKNLAEDLQCSSGIVMYDRGILDRMPWLSYSRIKGEITVRDYNFLEDLYHLSYVQKYKPLTYGFLTSPEISIQRKGKEGRLVNRRSIEQFNNCFEIEQGFIKRNSEVYTLTKTDAYQGQLQEFVMEMLTKMTGDIARKLEYPDRAGR